MAAFQIRRRSDARIIGWGDVDADDTQVTVQGLGLVVDRAAFDSLAESEDHEVVWPDGPPGS